MNYEGKSDYEVNEQVVLKIGHLDKKVADYDGWAYKSGNIAIYCDHHARDLFKDYCNDIQYAWPIIFDNKIDIYHDDDFSYAVVTIDGVIHEFQDKNPLRAAMICFLEAIEKLEK